MNAKQQRILASILLILAALNGSLSLLAQEIVGGISENIAGGASVFVLRPRRQVQAFSSLRSIASTPQRLQQRKVEYRQRRVQQSRLVAVNRPKPKVSAKPNNPGYANLPKEKAAEVLLGTAETHFAQKDYDEAERRFIEVRNLTPENERARFGLAAVLSAKGDGEYENKNYQAAIEFYEKSAALVDNNPDVYAALGEAYDALETDEARKKAVVAYENALRLDKSLTALYAPLGTIYYETGNLAEAANNLEKAVAANPNDAELQSTYASVLYKQNRSDEAMRWYQNVIRLNPNDAEAHFKLGEIYSGLKREHEAVAQYETVVRLNPDNADAHYNLGVAYYNRGEYEKAEQSYLNVARLNSANYQALLNLADTLQKLEKFDAAVNRYQIVASAKPEADTFSKFGYALGRTRNWKRSIEMLNKAVQMQPEAIGYTNLAWAYNNAAREARRMRKEDEAKQNYVLARDAAQKAVDLDPNFAAGYFNLGNAQAELRDGAASITALKRAVALRTNWAEAHNSLGVAYMVSKDWNNAATHLNEAIKINNDFAGAYSNLVVVELQRGNKKEAKKYFESVKRLSPALSNELNPLMRGI